MAKQANDFLEELANDPTYQRMIRDKEAQRAAIEAKNRKEEAALVEELRVAGVEVEVNYVPGERFEGPPRSVWDLVNTESRYPLAIPILVKHLQMDYGRDIKEAIVRALTTPESKGNAEVLIRMFLAERDSESQMKWLIGAAIAESATENDAQTIVELINNDVHGRGREYLPLGLIHLPKEDALAILERLCSDPVLGESSSKAIALLN